MEEREFLVWETFKPRVQDQNLLVSGDSLQLDQLMACQNIVSDVAIAIEIPEGGNTAGFKPTMQICT